MGGMGSGASRFRRIAEECQRIDIREWRRRGHLNGSCRFTWSWNCGGEPSGSIGVSTGADSITLTYTVTSDGKSVLIKERIALHVHPCRFARYRQLETRLNDDGSKPARMRWATYSRICEQLEAYDAASAEGLERVVARLMARYGN